MTITFPLPTELQGVGRVVGRFIVVTPDTANDIDVYPEARGATGSVTFTPSTKLSKTADYAAFVGHPSKTFPVDAYGVMQDEELTGGVWLREDVYTVSYDLSGLNIASHTIEVTSGHTEEDPLVLSAVGPAEPPTGSTLMMLQVPAGAVDGQLLSWSGTTGLVWVAGGAGGTVPNASTTVKGIAELATNQETIDGTDTTRAVTPAGVKAALDAKALSDMSTYATRIRAGAPRLTMSHVVHHTGGNFRWSTQTDESYVTFQSFYHLYNTPYKTTGPVYALSRPTVGGTLQHVWKSIDGGETWAKMFELTISQSTGVWFEHIFVESYYETVYLQKTTTGYSTPYAGFVESYTPAGVLIGSKAIGDSRWISGNHAIDYCPNTKHVVIFGEYASDTKAVVNLWRTENRGATWTSVLAPTGNNGGIAGEVRHFHAVAADPYTKHWWAASGDADAQCKIYRSTDDGVTWTVLYSGTQRERTTSFVFTTDYVYYGTDYPALTDDHSKLVRITKSDLSRTDVATIKDGFPVWALTKTYAPEGILVWPSCEFASNTPQDYVTVQWFDFATEELLDVARFTIADYTTGTEGIHDASRHQDVMTGSILFTPTSKVQRRGGFDTTIVSAFSKGRLVLPSA